MIFDRLMELVKPVTRAFYYLGLYVAYTLNHRMSEMSHTSHCCENLIRILIICRATCYFLLPYTILAVCYFLLSM